MLQYGQEGLKVKANKQLLVNFKPLMWEGKASSLITSCRGKPTCYYPNA